MNKKFAIHISTKNRINDLTITLQKIANLIHHPELECVVFDDGSNDGTTFFLEANYPKIIKFRNDVSKGYMFCRNKMLNESKADYVISLDDDAHFVTENPLEIIENHFQNNAKCAVMALRIFWGKETINYTETHSKQEQVKSFVGCGHVHRRKAWIEIPNYPEWFEFYGEEDFASYQLFKKGWEVHYTPDILIQHRVDVKNRKKDKDYITRTRRGLRAGWYLYSLFLPIRNVPYKIVYSIYAQFKNKTCKGDWKATFGLLLAFFDLMMNLLKIYKNSNRLTLNEYQEFSKLAEPKIYWKPEDERKNKDI